jgi:MFS family permease
MSEATRPTEERVANRWVVLALLVSVYALSAADRQLISVLAEPIRKDLDLSDTELGLLSGMLFAVFYTIFGMPFGWLADRVQRFRMIAGICIFWSGCTALTGLTVNFIHIALARVGVAVGESGASPASYSLISDHFPPERRGTAFGVYSVGFPMGAAIGTAAAAWIAAHHGWRSAFFAMALPGLLLAVLLFLIPHPRRGRLDGGPLQPVAAPRFSEVLREFINRPVLWMTALACSWISLASYGFLVWMPSLLMRTKGMTMMEISSTYSIVSGITQMAGAFGAGWLVDRLSRRTRMAYGLVPGIACLIAAPFTLAAVWAPDWQSSLTLMFVPFLMMVTWYPPALAVLQNECRPETRALMSGLFLTILGVIGTGGGPALVGFLSDYFAARDPATSLNWSLTFIVPFFVLSGVFHIANAVLMGRRERALAVA